MKKCEDYPGGYPMVYDPETGQTRVYPIPVPNEGIISVTPDEESGSPTSRRAPTADPARKKTRIFWCWIWPRGRTGT